MKHSKHATFRFIFAKASSSEKENRIDTANEHLQFVTFYHTAWDLGPCSTSVAPCRLLKVEGDHTRSGYRCSISILISLPLGSQLQAQRHSLAWSQHTANPKAIYPLGYEHAVAAVAWSCTPLPLIQNHHVLTFLMCYLQNPQNSFCDELKSWVRILPQSSPDSTHPTNKYVGTYPRTRRRAGRLPYPGSSAITANV
jgi:hypothetical protein